MKDVVIAAANQSKSGIRWIISLSLQNNDPYECHLLIINLSNLVKAVSRFNQVVLMKIEVAECVLKCTESSQIQTIAAKLSIQCFSCTKG